MKTKMLKKAVAILCLGLLLFTGIAFAEPRASEVFEGASVSIGSSMDADFSASCRYNCTSIYVYSCTLEKKDSTGAWVYANSLVPPSTVARNTSNFDAWADYASKCTRGNTYRIKAVFKASYGGTSYNVTRYSNSVNY